MSGLGFTFPSLFPSLSFLPSNRVAPEALRALRPRVATHRAGQPPTANACREPRLRTAGGWRPRAVWAGVACLCRKRVKQMNSANSGFEGTIRNARDKQYKSIPKFSSHPSNICFLFPSLGLFFRELGRFYTELALHGITSVAETAQSFSHLSGDHRSFSPVAWALQRGFGCSVSG